MNTFKEEIQQLIDACLEAANPYDAVRNALKDFKKPKGKVILVAIGKAAYTMAKATLDTIDVDDGIVVTKYGHAKGLLERVEIIEAGHPIPDENSFVGALKALDLVRPLTKDDTVIFLVSGGGSALFERSSIDYEELKDITEKLLRRGASIKEINTLRKHLSLIKGGRFAMECYPAHVEQIVLSDVLGDPLDQIASGPASIDHTYKEDAFEVANRYGIKLSEKAKEALEQETPKEMNHVESKVVGSVKILCDATMCKAKELGYEPIFLTDCLDIEAKEAGYFLGDIARTHQHTTKNIAFVCGGETVVHVKGKGLGGRNQELVLACSTKIQGLDHVALFSLGSDGTDGPTDAAGGIALGNTYDLINESNHFVESYLEENDAYHALEYCGGLIKTGPTGTNINDVTVLLIKAK